MRPVATVTRHVSKPDIKSVDDYMASKPGHVAEVLEIVRGAILKALPNVERTHLIQDANVQTGRCRDTSFRGMERSLRSLYPAPPTLVAAFKKELAVYEVERGTIRFHTFRTGACKTDRGHSEVPRARRNCQRISRQCVAAP